jgi:nucleoside-diphosphate-sugar epimerase
MTKPAADRRDCPDLRGQARENGTVPLGPKLVIGCGYLGLRVALRWVAAGETVYATTRSDHRADELRAQGIRPILLDVTQSARLPDLPQADTVLYALGYEPQPNVSRHDVYVTGLARVLDVLPCPTGRLIFISSTGVYGQNDGSWVNEDTPCAPDREGGREFFAAETLLRQHAIGSKTIILRMAGLYGPDRLLRVRDLKARRPMPLREDFLNLIHVVDMVEIVLQVERKIRPPALYLAGDGQPVDRRQYYEYLASQIGAPRPTFLPPDPNAIVAGRGAGSKRVDTSRLLRALGITLRYPSYREGLADLT